MTKKTAKQAISDYLKSEQPQWLNVPNCLTMLRMAMVPMFVWAFYEFPEKRFIALIIFLAASFTDCLDGFLARKFNKITAFGKLMDPLADKLMVVTMLCCLAGEGCISGVKGAVMNWVVPIIIGLKELYMITGSLYMLMQNVVVKSNILGKASTVLFILSIGLLFPWHTVEAMFSAGRLLLYLSAMFALMAMANYTIDAIRQRNEMRRKLAAGEEDETV